MRSIVTERLKKYWSGPPGSHGWTQTELVESYDPIMSLQSLSRIVGADGTLSRLVSNFQLKNWWRA
jgi:hypothetical protein